MRKVRVALSQINPTVGDLKGNAEKILHFVEEAKKVKADIVTFPELSVCGYPPEDLLLKKRFVKDNLKTLEFIAGNISGIIAVIGFVDEDKEGNIYNSAAIIKDRKIKSVYNKIELPNYGVFDEKRYFKQGNKIPVFVVGKIAFGVSICEDIWKKNGVAKIQKDRGAKIIINISSSPYHTGKAKLREKLLMERTEETKAYICYNNLVGGQDELVFDGASLILSPEGKEIARGKQFEEDLVIADLKVNSESEFKSKEYDYIIELGNLEDIELPVLKIKKPKRLTPLEEIYKALTLGTRDYVRKNGFEKVVIGLSGGIDSSLTAVIACDALGKENVVGISMPSRYSSEGTRKDAKILAQNLGIKFIEIPIDKIFNSYLESLREEFQGLSPDITEENIQARIRGNILMALSNKFGYLVLTTGNKSEVSCGYCTLYGDMAGGFNVLKDVFKTLVYKLANFRNRKEKNNLIPESIIKRPPTAELRPDQKDQDALPPYSILDEILKKYVEEGKSYTEIAAENKFDPQLIKKVIKMVDRNEYKRRQAPPGVKITPKAFGKDWRFPITNKYQV
ncbi:NAD+ synthase [Candidatus Aerophobetes bacterium]|nr:NAD+ synthase [Candidatus Aerophobetes bacterium]